MKKNNLIILLIASIFAFNQTAKAQFVSDIEDLTLNSESFWNGNSGSGGFTSGFVKYINHYNASWGTWSGFSYSNMTDRTTVGYVNQYSSITGDGALDSKNYVVGYGSDTIVLNNPANMDGLYITNSTYAYLDMLNGSDFSKKFNTNDWFKLTIKGLDINHTQIANLDFFLADFRFSDATKNYILNDWQWVDLSSFLNVSYLVFERSSSDNGAWGMNTPDYFCLDMVKIKGYTDVHSPRTNSKCSNNKFNVYSNQSNGSLTVLGESKISEINILDIYGRIVYTKSVNDVNVDLSVKLKGVYLVKVSYDGNEEYHKILFQ